MIKNSFNKITIIATTLLLGLLMLLLVVPLISLFFLWFWNDVVRYLNIPHTITYWQSLKLCFFIYIIKSLFTINVHTSISKQQSLEKTMVKLIPSDRGHLKPVKGSLNHILDILKNNPETEVSRAELLKKSKLTKTQTLRVLEDLIHSKKIVHDEINHLFYLL